MTDRRRRLFHRSLTPSVGALMRPPATLKRRTAGVNRPVGIGGLASVSRLQRRQRAAGVYANGRAAATPVASRPPFAVGSGQAWLVGIARYARRRGGSDHQFGRVVRGSPDPALRGPKRLPRCMEIYGRVPATSGEVRQARPRGRMGDQGYRGFAPRLSATQVAQPVHPIKALGTAQRADRVRRL